MSDVTKAARILSKLASFHRPAVYLEVEDILCKCKSSAELDFYYFWLCKGGRDHE